MKKYLLTVLSVIFSITLMGQTTTTTTIDNLTYTIISGTTNASVKKAQNANINTHVTILATVEINGQTYTVTEIENYAFQYANTMQGVTIPNTVTKIGWYAFQGAGCNPNEFVVNMGSGVETIGTHAFQNCQKLKNITIPASCDSIGNNAFADCEILVSIYIPNPDCKLGTEAFARCRGLNSIFLPTNLTTIPDGLLMNCDNNLREIIIPESVTYIGSQAFAQVHDAQIIFLGCGDAEGKITIGTDAYQNKPDAFQNNQRDIVEFFCIVTYGDRSVQFVKESDYNTPIYLTDGNNLFGNQLRGVQVPCGMETYYEKSLYNTTGDQQNLNNINEGQLCLAVTQKSGDFCDPETWRGYDGWIDTIINYGYPVDGSAIEKEAWLKNNDEDPSNDRWPSFVPRAPMHPFYIQAGHTVTLKHRRDIYPFNSVNNGVMVIDATCSDDSHNHYGQLIERDSVFFDANYTLDVEYSLSTVSGEHIITKDYPITTSTDITALINGSVGAEEGDYKREDASYIRDTKTRYLINITAQNEEELVADKDYYRIVSIDGVNHIKYYGVTQPYSSAISSLTTTPDANGFYKEGDDFIKHDLTYNGETITVTIKMADGNVTLHGTDYTYGHIRMHQNLRGEIEVKVPAEANKWNFVGAPFNVYDLYAVKTYNNGESDASVVRFDYNTNDWETVLSYGEDTIRPGEGFLAYPFYEGGITFSTKRDYSIPETEAKNGTIQPKAMESDFVLNNDTVYVEKNIADNKWMALANPYPAKLCVNSFVANNTATLSNSNPNPDPAQSNTTIQGQGVYILDVNSESSSWKFKPKTDPETEPGYDLGVGQGFFVNVKNNKTNKRIMFTKSQIHGYKEPQCEHGVAHSAKSSSQREFIKLSMIADNVASELLFAHNEDAQQYYDIYDANKLFAMERMTEPYFVTDGIKLVKEEVKELPYYATMNVRSYEEKEVKFRADYIPEGYAVSIIDGEETIDLTPGVEYTTEVSVGENANRFKVLVKKSVGLSDVEELAIDITNSNRIVNISTNETNLEIEVYNALGQRVFETRDLNFSLSDVSAGAYVVKAFNNKGSKTQKIVIR